MDNFLPGLVVRFVFNLIACAIFKTDKMFIPHWTITTAATVWYVVDFGGNAITINPISYLMLGFIAFDYVVYAYRAITKGTK
jgi:hypothetical protein